MYEVKTTLESLTSGEEEKGGHNSVGGGCGVPGDQHQVQCGGHQRVVQTVHTGMPPGVQTLLVLQIASMNRNLNKPLKAHTTS